MPRLEQGDPLGLQVVCMRRLREQGLILDPERALSRVLVEVAFELASHDGNELHPDWLQRCTDRALVRLVEIDREAERKEGGAAPRDDSPYRFVEEAFGVHPTKSRRATVAFHALPHRARLAFFVLLVDNTSLEETLALGLWSPEELRLDIWNVFRALGHLTPEEVEAFRMRKRRKE